MSKTMRSFRLEDDTLAGLEALAERWDLSKTGVIETLVQDEAERLPAPSVTVYESSTGTSHASLDGDVALCGESVTSETMERTGQAHGPDHVSLDCQTCCDVYAGMA